MEVTLWSQMTVLTNNN